MSWKTSSNAASLLRLQTSSFRKISSCRKSATKKEGAVLLELPDNGINLNEELEKFEKALIEKALLKAMGSKTRAAELLKISYDSLHYRSEKLGIGS